RRRHASGRGRPGGGRVARPDRPGATRARPSAAAARRALCRGAERARADRRRDRLTRSERRSRVGVLISTPQKIVCVGLNYRDHAEEQGTPLPDRPLLFAKWPNTLIGDGDPIRIPPVSQQVDYEAELGVVIGRRATGVSVADALDHVEGYVVANDVSGRDLQFAD